MYNHELNPYLAVLMVTVFASAATLLVVSKINDIAYASFLEEEFVSFK
jgi:hypothetical protein